MRQIYWRKRLADFRNYWTNPGGARLRTEGLPRLLSERLEERIVLAAPVAVDDTASTTEDAVVSIDVRNNDSDPDNNSFTVTHVEGQAVVSGGDPVILASGARVALLANGNLRYNPAESYHDLAAGESADDSFTYTITDSNGETGTATVTVTVNGVNDPPTATDRAYSTNADQTVTINLRGGTDPLFVDVDTNDTLTYFYNGTELQDGVAVPLHGGNPNSATITYDAATQTLLYDPGDEFVSLGAGDAGSDLFAMTAEDEAGTDATADVTINLTGVNDAPTGVDDGAVTSEGTPVAIDVLDNDTDPDTGDTLTVTQINGTAFDMNNMVALASGATVTRNPDGTLTYDPGTVFDGLGAGESDVDSFTYTLSDGEGGTDTATVNVTINGINDPPTAADDAATTTEDESVVINVLANDSDPNAADTLTVIQIDGNAVAVGESINLASGARVTRNANGTLTYNPLNGFHFLAAGESDSDLFTYTISDGNGGTATATVEVTVTGVNDPPVATDRTYGTDADQTVTISLRGGVDPLFVDADANDTLTYFFDGTELQDGVAVALDPLNPDSATITLNAAAQTLLYDPGAEFAALSQDEPAVDGFAITARDLSLAEAAADVTVNITGVNDPPTAANDAASTTEDETVDIDVLTNDVDPDAGDTLTVTRINGNVVVPEGTEVLDALTGRSVTLNLDGTLTYDPGTAFDFLNPGEMANDSFTYTISDGEGGTSTATVSLTIDGVNDAPVAVDDNAATNEDAAVVIDVLANDEDADNGAVLAVTHIDGVAFDPLNGNVVTLSNGATVTLNADGTLTYDPGPAFQGLSQGDEAIAEFEYTVTDQFGASSAAPGTVSVTVAGANDPTVAFNRSFITSEDNLLTINLRTGSNALFFDPDVSDDLVYSIDIFGVPTLLVDGVPLALNPFNPDSSTVTLNAADGTLTYDPRDEFDSLTQGQLAFDSFMVSATDGLSPSVTSFVDILIVGANDPPVAVDDAANTNEDTAVVIDVLANDEDPDAGAILRVTQINGIDILPGQTVTLDPLTGVRVTLNLDGTLTYDPGTAFDSLNPGESDSATFEYTLADEVGAVAPEPGEVTVTITGLNDPPVAENDSAATDENSPIVIDVLENDSDPDDGATLNVSAVNGIPIGIGGTVTLPSGATVTRNADGTLTYDPGTAFDRLSATQNGSDAFDYTLVDQTGAAALTPGTVNITIDGLNDVPVVLSSDLNVFRNLTLRQLHQQLAPGTPHPTYLIPQLLDEPSIVEGESVRLPIKIFDPDNDDRLTVQLFLVSQQAFNSLNLADPDSVRISATTPGVILLDSLNGLQANAGGEVNAVLSATIPDDFPLGTPSDDYVFVLQFNDRLVTGSNDAVVEPQFDPADPTYTIVNHTPFLDAPGLVTSGGTATGVLQPSIEFVLVGNEFEATVNGFVLDSSTSPNEAIFVTLIDTSSGRILTGSLPVQTTSIVTAATKTIDSDGNIQNETVRVGRFFTATFRAPVTSDLVNFSGTQLQVRMIVEDDDGGESSLSGLTARFPAFVLPPIEPVEQESEEVAVVDDATSPTVPPLTIVRRFERTQTPLSGKIETDSFEALVRIVVADAGDNGEPLYQYIELFEATDADEESTIDVARIRLEQFLQQISQLPDNRYQIVLRQSRGELIVTETVILDVIVVDGEIIERQEESRPAGAAASDTTTPETGPAGDSHDLPADNDAELPAGRAGSVALPLLALAEFRRRRRASTRAEPQSRAPRVSAPPGASAALWRARLRGGSNR